jgi:hypothetical protein
MPKSFANKPKDRLMFLGICVLLLIITSFSLFITMCSEGKCGLGKATIVPRYSFHLTRGGLGDGAVVGIVNGQTVMTLKQGVYEQWADFRLGTVLKLYATASSNSKFAGWMSLGDCSNRLAPTCSITINRDKGARATFDMNVCTMSVMKDGLGNGSFYGTVNGRRVFTCDANCMSPQYYSAIRGTVVKIYASPDSNSTFAGWTGIGCSGRVSPCLLKMDGEKGVRAKFNTRR